MNFLKTSRCRKLAAAIVTALAPPLLVNCGGGGDATPTQPVSQRAQCMELANSTISGGKVTCHLPGRNGGDSGVLPGEDDPGRLHHDGDVRHQRARH